MSSTKKSPHPSRFPPQRPAISPPLYAQWPTNKITQGAGVAIFHLKTSRVVVCYHSRDRYWFLPKGRKDQGETIEQAAVREGFEEVSRSLRIKRKYMASPKQQHRKKYKRKFEYDPAFMFCVKLQSGYRNRLLPLPFPTRQTHPRGFIPYYKKNVTEPVWIQLLPLTPTTNQYLLHWFIAETVPLDVDKKISDAEREEQKRLDALTDADLGGGRYKKPNPYPYHRPPPFPHDSTLKDRIADEIDEKEEPMRHDDTSADAEEELYESSLLDINIAQEKLAGTVEADVVRMGWEAIQERMGVESAAEQDGTSHLLFFNPHDE